MHPAESWASILTCRRALEFGGRHLFDLHFAERNAFSADGNSTHGVPNLAVIDQYHAALESSISRLTDKTHGWNLWESLPGSNRALRDAAVFDLGPSMLGAAVDTLRGTPYLVLNTRSLDLPEVARMRRQATVSHELVHLLQFETPAYRYWPARGRIGENRDPNWWLHEATALALESEISPAPTASFPLLWNWATSPEQSLEGDPYGTLAAPFLIYLGRRFGWDLLADVYRATEHDVEGMRGVDLLARALGRRGDSPPDFKDCFARGYCVDAAFIGDGASVLPAEIKDVIGPRALSGRFTRYPVDGAARNLVINHLGCRYFEFTPTQASRMLKVQVAIHDDADRLFARVELVTVGRSGLRRRTTLSPQPDTRLAATVEFSSEDVSRAVLIISNCAYGSGWATHDGLRVAISAQIE